MFRIGFGNDIHRLLSGLPLVLGGVQVDSNLGAEGHSDADALTHAITDALLGAIAAGDIGTHFSPSDERWANAESFVFLRYAVGLVKEKGYVVANVDSTIELERPKLRDYIPEMIDGLSRAMGIDPSQVSIKAKTGEGVDAVGERRAIKATAVVLLQKSET